MLGSISYVDWVIVALLIMLILSMIGIRSALSRVESKVGQLSKLHSESSQLAENPDQKGQGGAFEAFLAEDPQRLSLPKAEQFAAYRQWRKEKGMNWSNS